MRKTRDYEAAFYGVLFGIGVLCLWYFTSFVVEGKVIPTSAGFLISGLITLFTTAIGAAFGAYSAFTLQNQKEEESAKLRQKSTLRIALFTLFRQLEAVESIKVDTDSYKKSNSKSADFPPIITVDYSELKVSIDELHFIAEGDFSISLVDLTITQSIFELATSALDYRNNYYWSEINPTYFELKKDSKNKDLKIVYDEKLNELEGLTEKMCGIFNESHKSLDDFYSKLKKYAELQYPNYNFTSDVENYRTKIKALTTLAH